MEIKLKLEESLNEFLERDKYLVLHDVHEQAITSKIACYLEKRVTSPIEGGWDVDVEYNRNGEAPKSLRSEGNVKPDIIVHRRGRNNIVKTGSNNLLVIEVKKDPSDLEKETDIRKVKAFMEESPFYYCYGAFVEIKTNPIEYKTNWFSRNKLENTL